MKIVMQIYGKVPAKSSRQRVGIRGGRFSKARAVMYKDSTCRDYEEVFSLQVPRDAKGVLTKGMRLSGVILWFVDSLRQDVDSPGKIILDLLQANKVVPNDNMFDDLRTIRVKTTDPKDCRAIIIIEQVNQERQLQDINNILSLV